MATKAEMITAVAERAGTDKKSAEAVLSAFFDQTAEQVKQGEKVTWPGFGNFSMGERGARKGRRGIRGHVRLAYARREVLFRRPSGGRG